MWGSISLTSFIILEYHSVCYFNGDDHWPNMANPMELYHVKFLVSCPACTCLPVRNGLVNKVKFLGLISPKVLMTNKIVRSIYYIVLPLHEFTAVKNNKYPYLFLSWFGIEHC